MPDNTNIQSENKVLVPNSVEKARDLGYSICGEDIDDEYVDAESFAYPTKRDTDE